MSVTSGQDTIDLSGVEEFSGEDIRIELSFTQKINEFLEKQKIEENSPYFYLYKYEDYRSGEVKSFIAKYRDCDPPDEDEIGREYGSGRYLMVMAIPSLKDRKQQMRAYRFRIHARYDALVKKQSIDTPASSSQQIIIPQQNQPSFNDAFTLIERMMSIMIPLFNRPKDDNIQDILSQSYSSVNEVMKRSMIDQYKMMNEFQKSLVSQSGENMGTAVIEDEEKGPSMLETLAPLLNEWLPKLLGGGPQAAMVKQVVQHTPQFQQILKDKIELKSIINYLDESRGPEETDKILAALNIQRSGNQKAVAKRGRPGTRAQ